MIERDITQRVRDLARAFPVLTLTGPRQSGKSTLARGLFPGHAYVSLEAPDVRAFALEDPRGFLAQFEGGAVLDEIQRAPDLLSYLQGLVDADTTPGRWVLTGSQDFALIESVGQSLAGRAGVLQLLPLARSEVLRFPDPPTSLDEALFAGGYPRIFDKGLDPKDWLGAYVATYVERDVRSLLKIGDLVTFQRFVELCAGRTAQLVNLSALAADAGVTQPTAKAWLGVLEASFLVLRIPAFHSNQRKRLVKAPKLHFHDTGLVCWLLGIRDPDQLRSHPLRGAIFETWVASEIHKHRANRGERAGLFHYRDSAGREGDLVVERGGRLVVVESKSSATPAQHFLDGVRRVREQISAGGGDVDVVVVFGGDGAQRRGDGQFVPWRELHDGSWA